MSDIEILEHSRVRSMPGKGLENSFLRAVGYRPPRVEPDPREFDPVPPCSEPPVPDRLFPNSRRGASGVVTFPPPEGGVPTVGGGKCVGETGTNTGSITGTSMYTGGDGASIAVDWESATAGVSSSFTANCV